MPKETWIIASVLSVLLVVGIIGFSSYQKGVELDKAQAELAETQATNETVRAEAEALKTQLAENKALIDKLREQTVEVAQAKSNLEQQMRAALESKDVTISELQGKLEVNILDRVLFDTGQAALKPEGAQVLDKVATILAQYPNRQIHVIGHTDNIPIRAGAHSRYQDNWDLSAARAIAAVRFLSEKTKVDPKRLAAVGYGEFHPLADNTTPEGRAKNRRITLVVMPEVFAEPDNRTRATKAPAAEPPKAEPTPTAEVKPTEVPAPADPEKPKP